MVRTANERHQLTISAYSRLHLTLLAMHNGEYRINGGLGFAIADPSCELTFSSSADFAINDQRANPLGVNELEQLVTLLQAEQKRCNLPVAAEIAINGNMRAHSGFGSGTAISLACLEALHGSTVRCHYLWNWLPHQDAEELLASAFTAIFPVAVFSI